MQPQLLPSRRRRLASLIPIALGACVGATGWFWSGSHAASLGFDQACAALTCAPDEASAIAAAEQLRRHVAQAIASLRAVPGQWPQTGDSIGIILAKIARDAGKDVK